MSLDSQRLPYGDGRDALLAAVIDVVAEKGLRGVTYRSVASRAGVNHTLITHHFGSIEGLLAATLEWAVQRSIDETGLARVADFDEQFADALLASVASEPELQLFQFEMLLEARRKPELKALLDRLYDNYISTVETALRQRSLDTDDELSRAVFAALDGLMLQFLTFGNPGKIRSAVVQVGRLLERSGAAGDANAAGLSPAKK
ncbi:MULTISPECIES: TetR/AcrR family transcriptional regulator [unclassified Arthrobacter]|uniref:TetR/AcrR family transcriptional regulator n=1 Tax=unclassified Arthrobacter TaxID=235627 RepID=UPI001F005611|nr:TetR family transcriptional regulator [Arthrobacter sp. FW305-BF8]UKA56370.1 TetR family transcriptional regulator [Arthrobacter sp. FW305-BF8]